MFKSIKTIAALAVAAAALRRRRAGLGSDELRRRRQPRRPAVELEPGRTSATATRGKKCTWVLNDAYGNPGGEKAPKSGTLKKIKLIAGEPGSFKLQLVKVEGRQLRQGRHQRAEDHLRGSGRPERRHLRGRDVQGRHPGPQGRAARDRDQGDQHPALQLRRRQHPALQPGRSRSATPSQALGSRRRLLDADRGRRQVAQPHPHPTIARPRSGGASSSFRGWARRLWVGIDRGERRRRCPVVTHIRSGPSAISSGEPADPHLLDRVVDRPDRSPRRTLPRWRPRPCRSRRRRRAAPRRRRSAPSSSAGHRDSGVVTVPPSVFATQTSLARRRRRPSGCRRRRRRPRRRPLISRRITWSPSRSVTQRSASSKAMSVALRW